MRLIVPWYLLVGITLGLVLGALVQSLWVRRWTVEEASWVIASQLTVVLILVAASWAA